MIFLILRVIFVLEGIFFFFSFFPGVERSSEYRDATTASSCFGWREFMHAIAEIIVLPFINVCPFPRWGFLFGQACKALHAQIKHYNTSFQKEYGHPPRRRERVPLVSTYAQYKSWRQFICDDASTQLQVSPC